MQDQIVVLKNTKQGIKVDTVYTSNDTLFIDFNGKSIIEIPDKRIEVNNFPPPKDGWDIAVIIAAIVGGLTALIGTYLSLKKLNKKSDDTQNQVDKLSELAETLKAQNELIEKSNSNQIDLITALSKSIVMKEEQDAELKRIERRKYQLMVMPNLKVGGQGTRGSDHFQFQIINYGESCTVDKTRLIEGAENVSIGLQQGYTIEKNQKKLIAGTSQISANRIGFKLRIEYHDKGDFKYESIITWKNFDLSIETKEL